MSTMPKRLFAIALALAFVVLPAGAQRGGSHSTAVGHGGGFTSSRAPAFHSSFTGPSRSGFTHSTQFSGARFVPVRQAPGRITVPGNYNRRNDHDSAGGFRGIDRNRDQRFRRPYAAGYGLGLPYSLGFIDPNYLSYPDSGYDDSTGNAPQQPPPDDYGALQQYAGPPPEQYAGPPPDQAYAAPDSSYRPAYQRPQPEASLPSQEAVTLVFKDGRPNEQIYNYMLTRSTLYIQGQHLREISVDQLDLAAMAKVNGDAGVVFKLPGR